MLRYLLPALVLVGFRPAAAFDGSAAPIATDRPSVTDSSIVVPLGSFQDENGFADTVSQGLRTFDGSESLLRLGVAPKTELRLTLPEYFNQTGVPSGFDDLIAGMKRQLGPIRGGFDVSLVVAVSMPTGARAISSHGYDPFLQLPWSRAVSGNWTAAGMFSVNSPTQDGRHNVTGEATFLMDRQLTKPLDMFVEYAGDFPEQGGPRHFLHFGTTYKVTPHQQIDMHGGVGLSSAAVDYLVGIGYSFRVQLWRGR
jgi:hypothetical protein